MAVVRFSSVHLSMFLLLLLQVHLATDTHKLVVETLVVLSKHVLAEYLPVTSSLAAKHPDLLNTP